jgi:hypothetical protein
MSPDTTAPAAYTPPVLRVLGTVADLTQGCDKKYGASDGFTFQGASITCGSA